MASRTAWAPRGRLSISNAVGGRIIGTVGAWAHIDAGGNITNAGTITGKKAAALLTGGGVIVNQAGGLLTATGTIGAYITGGDGTITNAGTITGSLHAVRFSGNHADRLIDVPGAVFSGDVVGGSGSNTLELAAGTSAATSTLTGFGTQFIGFGSIVVDAGARWAFDASDPVGAGASASLTNGTPHQPRFNPEHHRNGHERRHTGQSRQHHGRASGDREHVGVASGRRPDQ